MVVFGNWEKPPLWILRNKLIENRITREETISGKFPLKILLKNFTTKNWWLKQEILQDIFSYWKHSSSDYQTYRLPDTCPYWYFVQHFKWPWSRLIGETVFIRFSSFTSNGYYIKIYLELSRSEWSLDWWTWFLCANITCRQLFPTTSEKNCQRKWRKPWCAFTRIFWTLREKF